MAMSGSLPVCLRVLSNTAGYRKAMTVTGVSISSAEASMHPSFPAGTEAGLCLVPLLG
jgi:hypothetical protein